VIYAVEEPETSQHPNHQIMLLDTFESLVDQGKCQVLVTTHTPTLARRVDRNNLRLISMVNGACMIEHGKDDATLQKIRETLGVLPDHDVKVFFGVEGKNDINFMQRISAMLAKSEPDIPDLAVAEGDRRLVFVPLGGSSLELWITRLQELNRPEFYLTDRDEAPPLPPRYQSQIVEWQSRGCTAWSTSKRELENYLHPSILAAQAPGYGGNGDPFEDAPALYAEAIHLAAPGTGPWSTLSVEKKKDKKSAAKKRLNTTCAELMTAELLTEADPHDEIRTWLRAIGKVLNA
jgi:putative ATP-dependent endonuclease of the OLD family